MNANEPVAYILMTGHGTKIVDKKPFCEVDLWQGLYLESFVRQQQAEIEAGKIMIKGYGKAIDEQQAEILILKNELKNCKKIIKAQEK